jgi:hypothetical protein
MPWTLSGPSQGQNMPWVDEDKQNDGLDIGPDIAGPDDETGV